MASPAAILSVLVKADGIAQTNKKLQGLHGGLGTTSKAAGKMGDDLDKGARKGSRALGSLKSVAGPAAAAFGAIGIAGAVKLAVGEFQEARKVGAQTNQVIKTTGGVANVSAKHVAGLATSISKKVGIDDEAIQSGSNLLLTFKNIRNETGKGKDIFDQATKAAVDLSAAGFGSLSSTSKQLGKALNDPVKGMTALGRSGVTFSDDQKKAIAALMNTGKAADRVKAQQIVLKEVQSQVGGSAKAQATTMDHLKVTLSNLAEAAGAVLVPMLDKAGKFLNTLINQMIEGKGAGGAIVSTFKTVGGAIGAVVGIIKGAVSFFAEHKTLTYALAAATAVFALAYTATLIPALIASTAAIYAQVAGWVALKLAFLTSPIGLVLVAFAALAAALVIAYQKSATFRAIVDAVWAAIKTAAGVVWDVAKVVFPALVGALASAVTAVWDFVTHLDKIPGKILDAGTAIVNGIVDGIKALPGLLAGAATWLWNTVKAGLEAYLAAYKAVGSWVLNRIVDGFKAITELLGSVGAWLKNRIFDFVKLEIQGVKNIGGWLLARIVDGFKLVTDLLNTVGDWLRGKFFAIVKLSIEGFKAIGGWILEKFVGGFKAAVALLDKIGDWLRGRFWDAVKLAKDGFLSVGGAIIGWIVDGLKAGLNGLIGFVNKIIHVINKIPGVDIKDVPLIKNAEGGVVSKAAVAGYAQGGLVNKPIVMMGEEAPRHPEYVIPTNPAYRKRAHGLLRQAAGAIGFADGGVLSAFRSAAKDVGAPPKANLALWEAGIVESGLRNLPYGDADSRGALQIRDSTAAGMGINNMDPYASAIAFLTRGFWSKGGANLLNMHNPDQSAGWIAQNVQGSAYPARYDQVMSQALNYVKGYSGPVGGGPGILSDIASALNPLDFINKLPGLGDLPSWLKGTGKYILDKVGDYIKSTVASIIPGGGGGGGGGETSTSGLVPQVKRALAFAGAHGWRGIVTSGFRSHAEQAALYARYLAGGNIAAKPGSSSHEVGQAVDVTDVAGFARAMAMAPTDSKLRNLVPGDALHFSVTGHKMGGILGQGTPFVGSYGRGGTVPADGLGYLHQGETVTPKDGGALAGALERNTAMMERLVASGMAGVMAAIADEVSDRTGAIVGLRSQAVGIPGAVA